MKEIKNKTGKRTRYLMSKIIIEILLKENLITHKEFEIINEKNKKSFGKR